MSDYDGPMRRTSDSEMYGLVCSQRFDSINKDLADLKRDVIMPMDAKLDTATNKLTNGLSDLPHEVAALRKLLISVLVSFIVAALGLGAGIGLWIYHIGKLEQKLDNHIEWGMLQQAENESVIRALENKLYE